ncbi:hypothetical protein HRbin08_00086 [bacterium HR08]|nr:hypothetical protein HRbin08_00086 [bacterium HR08]
MSREARDDRLDTVKKMWHHHRAMNAEARAVNGMGGEARGIASGVSVRWDDHILREHAQMKRVKRTGLGPPRPEGVT